MHIDSIFPTLPLPSLSRSCRLLLVAMLLLGTTACDRLSPEQDTETEVTAAKHASSQFPREWSKRVIETEDGPIVEFRMNNVLFHFPKAIVVSANENGTLIRPKWPTMESTRSIADPDMIQVAISFQQLPPFGAKRAQITGPDSDMARVEDPATPDLLVYEHGSMVQLAPAT